MPAVQLAHLKVQLTELSWQFTRPADFQRSLKDLFEQYADRVYRAGQGVPAIKFIAAYHLPPILLRQLEQELTPFIQENPTAALAIADTLWKDAYLEPRQVAAYLLGQTPVNPPDAVLKRLRDWCQPQEDRISLNAVLNKGCFRLRREAPQAWFELLEDWLEHNQTPYQIVALQALLPAAQDRSFENLPPIYQLVTPLLKNAPQPLQAELLDVLNALAKRSPVETAYILRQVLASSTRPATARLVRKLLPAFDAQTQERLRAAFGNLGEEESPRL